MLNQTNSKASEKTKMDSDSGMSFETGSHASSRTGSGMSAETGSGTNSRKASGRASGKGSRKKKKGKNEAEAAFVSPVFPDALSVWQELFRQVAKGFHDD